VSPGQCTDEVPAGETRSILPTNANVAQLVERLVANQKVFAGSNPVIRSGAFVLST